MISWWRGDTDVVTFPKHHGHSRELGYHRLDLVSLSQSPGIAEGPPSHGAICMEVLSVAVGTRVAHVDVPVSTRGLCHYRLATAGEPAVPVSRVQAYKS
jgi:hypothetical protein